MSLGTLRIGFLVRGHRGLAGPFGFYESMVRFVAVAQVLTHPDSPLRFLGKAAGAARR